MNEEECQPEARDVEIEEDFKGGGPTQPIADPHQSSYTAGKEPIRGGVR